MVFYEYFLKSSIGDSEWKDICLKPETGPTMPLVNRPLEAFAMIMFENNYMAWLLCAKRELGDDLVTDYDEDKVQGTMKYFTEDLLKDMEVDLIDMPPDITEFIVSEEEEKRLLVSSTEPRHIPLKTLREEQLVEVRLDAAMNRQYKELIKELQKEANNPNQEQEKDGEALEKKRKERRKTLKKFRVFTNPTEPANVYKGWSKDTPVIQTKIVAQLREDDLKYQQFRAAYRLNFRMRNEKQSRKRRSIQEEPEFDKDELYNENTVQQRVEI